MQKAVYILFALLIPIFFGALSLVSPPEPQPMGAYLNGVFPKTNPSSTWTLEDPMPDFRPNAPLRTIPFPDSDDLLMLCKWGEIWQVSLENQTQKRVLDIRSRTFNKGEGGSVGMALHPQFGQADAPEKQVIFVFYRTKPEPAQWSEQGFNRLSKFTWNDNTQAFDPESEEILIQQFDRMTWHNGGGMFFGEDGFLYMTLGDEGDQPHQAASTQRLDGGLFSGIIRIDVDMDDTRSHPIRRQPKPNANPLSDWADWETFSQGYYIPDDNPWQSPDGSQLEEFYALGLRSPYAMMLDEETQQIWITDVGSDKYEEVNVVERGDNLQWPYMEGNLASELHKKPENLIGKEKLPFFQYDRSIGSCIMGGGIYRGTKFPELNGKFLMADWSRGKIMALNNTSDAETTELETLISDIKSLGVDVPEKAGITSLNFLSSGDILITVMGERSENPANFYLLKRKESVAEPPAKLSELGVFTDLQTLETTAGLIPYKTNASLWSDRAVKRRWMALPNDGTFDTEAEVVKFHGKSEWEFPEGTVFVKHFDLPRTTDPTAELVRLETRFFIIGEGGVGYGLTYKWNEEGTEAFLLGGGTSREIDIYENGQVLFTQKWDYPSRDQCMTCHNANAKYVLGVKTHQLNGELFYPQSGLMMNQLDYLNQMGVFQDNIGSPNNYLKAYAIDDQDADLQTRVRSYLDSNCSSCHRLGGVPEVSLDLRFTTPLHLQNIVNMPTQSQNSVRNHSIVQPGAHEVSELWVRDASNESNRMPPIARNMVDEIYIDALAAWIDQLSEDAAVLKEMLLYPNPSSGRLSLLFPDDWSMDETASISVFSITGQKVFQGMIDTRSYQLDLSEMAGGSYILEVVAGERRIVQKIVLY